MAPEFQAVIMAGGLGARLAPFTDSLPKPMLPVANKPLLSYQLDLLRRSGFPQAIVVIRQSSTEQVRQYLDSREKDKNWIDVELISFPDEQMGGTADVLRKLRRYITTNFFVLSGDLITNTHLQYMADMHRTRKCTMTLLLKRRVQNANPVTPSAQASAGGADKGNEDVRMQYIGLDAKSSRVLYLKAAADVDEANGEVVVSKSILMRYPQMLMQTQLQDMHLYLFSINVLDLLDEKPHISSIQGELVPYLAAAQFTNSSKEWAEDHARTVLTRAVSLSDMAPIAASPSVVLSADISAPVFPSGVSRTGSGSKDIVQCFAQILPDNVYCARSDSVPAYYQMNNDMQAEYDYTPWVPVDRHLAATIAANPGAQVGASIFGTDVTIGKASIVKKSSIGDACRIGDDCKLSNCIVMAGCVIEKGCNLQNTILGPQCILRANVQLRNCRVGGHLVVPAGADHKNDTIANENTEV